MTGTDTRAGDRLAGPPVGYGKGAEQPYPSVFCLLSSVS